jgi:hypothetical protein
MADSVGITQSVGWTPDAISKTVGISKGTHDPRIDCDENLYWIESERSSGVAGCFWCHRRSDDSQVPDAVAYARVSV